MSSTVPPNLPSPAAGSAAAPTATARGTIVDAPDPSALTRGAPLEGRVVSGSAGQLVIATSAGRLTVQTPVTLPTGSLVTLQVQTPGPTPQIVLQFSPAGAAPSAAANPGATQPTTDGVTPPVSTRLTLGSTLQATVVRSALDAAGPAAPRNVAGAPAQATATPAAAPAAAGPAQGAPAPLVGGAGLSLRLLAFAPAGGTLATSTPGGAPLAANTLIATVTGQQTPGSILVSANSADLILQNATALPPGSKLLLEVVKTYPPAARGGNLHTGIGGRWDALNEALVTLQQTDPALARSILDARVPNPGPRLAASTLFFLSAVLSGDMRRFLGADAMRQLQRGAGGVLDRLSGEMGQLQRTAVDATGQDWRLFLVPLLTEDGLSQLRLLVRDNASDGNGNPEEAGTRFIVEVEMSRLGPFQFDGLTRNKHLDLVVRTQKELPTSVRDTIRSIFGNTVTALGFSGTVALRTVTDFPVSPVDANDRNPSDLTV